MKLPSRLADDIAAALVLDDLEVVEAMALAERALAAWSAFPRSVRLAYPREAHRLARRAAAALVAVLEASRSRADATH